MWWGLYLIAVGETRGWATFFSALLITVLLRYATGCPYIENKYAENEEWKQYTQETNMMVPWVWKGDSQVAAKVSNSEAK